MDPVPGIEVASVDTALSTTRAVRRRLDLERAVDDELVLDCIDIAEQAPTGGALASRRWLVIRDDQAKADLAQIYRDGAGSWMMRTADRLAGTGHPDEAMMASAAHLVDNLHRVPVIVIPTIIGRHDGSGRPGLFDSVIQAAWSFCVAMRARGLGTAWVTAPLADESRVKARFDLPPEVTEIVMLPVAWTIGTDFSPAPRPPARQITYFEGWGRTFQNGPGRPARLADGPGAVAEIDLDASPARVWELVSDIELPARFSEEFLGARWLDEPAPGARFVGRNRHPLIGEWEVTCHLDAWEPERAIGWRTSDPQRPGAQWRFDLAPRPGGTRLTFSLVLGPGPSGLTAVIESRPDQEAQIIEARLSEHLANMRLTLAGIAELLSGS